MPEESNNWTLVKTEGNLVQSVLQDLAWDALSGAHTNGSTPAMQFPHTQPTAGSEVVRGSGIIPGGIAAAVFISFLLALYAVLWKCMVAAPKRHEKKRKAKTQQLKGPLKELIC
ncbi:uncharacterized protein [Lepisosteus oculatus]|uniref:uncharacterized protein n=1 Tax=Lepisosteus oculatus TaxID=7918 RepID=UPI0035F5066E